MTGSLLQKAREYEAEYGPRIAPEERPVFHVTPAVGWMNDPNGFSVYRGEYHLFYQYNPYSVRWDRMHWGHLKTRDFIRWERLPAALAPDADFDRDGCFSGSAAEMPDGRQLLVYTGVRGTLQAQCVAFGDGVDYEKHPLNPVIGADALPEGGSPHDFRDPKVWREDGRYFLAVGNRPADGTGSVLLYESDDALSWRYGGILAACRGEFGRMWECPDFFPLDGKHVLLVSPQEMEADGKEFRTGSGNVCLIGTFDRASHCLIRERAQAVDLGLDFYAPQTLETPDGRRVMIAWMQDWATVGRQPEGIRYFGEMTLPRELSLRDGRLIQQPVRELERYRRDPVIRRGVALGGAMALEGVSGRVLDMTVSVRPAGEGALYRSFTVGVASDGEHRVTVRFTPADGTVRIDRSRSGFAPEIANVRDFAVRADGGAITLRLILDRHSLELFVNGGEQAASAMIRTDPRAEGIFFEADGSAVMDVEKYRIAVE